ncbi:CapA family protein [Sharpea azabuensis]|uniref:CapA family protein n=1 Tax=Sharpea azabuensis TaxID=322505 RepID=UPI00156A9AFE|nr:CapA family protein [Sharpea azabuensis]MEE3308971.1 CapA family protein [Sharpea azabuensis]
MKKLALLLTAFLLAGCTSTPATKKVNKPAVKKETKTKETKDTTITISATGDVTLGKGATASYSTSMIPYYKQYGPAYFFKNVKDTFTKDDYTLVNFEGTLTNSNSLVTKTFNFKADKDYIKIIQDGGVDAVSFANNHAYDYGKEGYDDTINTFKENKMPYASYDAVSLVEVKGKKIGNIGVDFSGLNQTKFNKSKAYIDKGIKKLKKDGADLIIVSQHGGIERQYTVEQMQKDLAHYAIDQGANLVIGHHPHVVQGVEKYKNAYIAYSLGNFCFGGNQNPADKDTMIFQQSFTFKNDKLEHNDNIKIIPASISSVTNRNNYQPTIAEGTTKKRIINKVNQSSSVFKIAFNEDGTLKK